MVAFTRSCASFALVGTLVALQGVPTAIGVQMTAESADFVSFDTSSITAGSAPRSVASEDLNGDGNLDLVVANFASDDISVLLATAMEASSPSRAFPQARIRAQSRSRM
jgi:FG-GAP repeat